MKRKIVKIDESKCNGCGVCIPNCHEGALQMIDGKARLISDLFCDGLGACIGHCPEGAITIEEREAEVYNETKVMEYIAKQGANTIKAHLLHLKEHGEHDLFQEGVAYLRNHQIPIPDLHGHAHAHAGHSGCPGSREMVFEKKAPKSQEALGEIESELRQWPIQLQLINPNASYLRNAELVVTADCVPFAFADYHRKFLVGKVPLIFCPKLDSDLQSYVEKLAMIFQNQGIKSVTIVHMEVPCCFGIAKIVEAAMKEAGVLIPVQDITITIDGKVK